jgi:hypothetical protein
MSKSTGQTYRYRFENETKTFWYRSRISLENILFRFGQESAFLDKIEMIYFDKTNSGMNSIFFVSFLLDILCTLESTYSTVLRVFCCFRSEVLLDLFMLIFHRSNCTVIRSGYAPSENLINYTLHV